MAIALVVTVLLLIAALVTLSVKGASRRRRLSRIQAGLTELSRGSLAWRAESHKSDDVGRLAAAVNLAGDQIRALAGGVHNCVDAIDGYRLEVDQIGLSMMDSAEQTATQAIAALDSAVEISSSLRLLTVATDDLLSTIHQVARNAGEASAISDIASARATAVKDTVDELSRASRSVGDITNLIAAIAGRTSLLSLNARIEAARAGAAGRGFDVVAGEVEELARETAHGTGAAGQTLAEIDSGSDRAAAAIEEIAATIATVTEIQGAISVAVEQQSDTAAKVGQACAKASVGATAIENTIGRMTTIARGVAYDGPAARNTASALGEVESALRGLLAGFDLSDPATMDEVHGQLAPPAATVLNGVTTITCDVAGTGLNQWEYVGRWCRSDANELSGDADAYTSMPDDVAILQFRGEQVKLLTNMDAHHGMMAVSIDDGPETRVDQYSATRRRSVVVWESPKLSPGTHTLRARVLPIKNPEARYFWITIDRAEVR